MLVVLQVLLRVAGGGRGPRRGPRGRGCRRGAHRRGGGGLRGSGGLLVRDEVQRRLGRLPRLLRRRGAPRPAHQQRRDAQRHLQTTGTSSREFERGWVKSDGLKIRQSRLV